MGAPSAAVVDMWQLLTIQIFLVTAADARNCFAWAVGLTLWLRDRRFFPNFDAAIYASLYGHFVREMHKTIPPSFLEDRRKQGFESGHGLSLISVINIGVLRDVIIISPEARFQNFRFWCGECSSG